jgi:outer membrane protein OmpA-like peptidoglycan-associated protein
VLVVFNGDTVTLSGAVPNLADGQELSALASAYSKTPNPKIVDQLTIDPSLTNAAGVRVIEMVAARFAPGSAALIPQQAPDFMRVVNLMKAKPGLTVMAIGHADQQGNSTSNLQLSQARAVAVVDFLVANGISPDRLSAQGDGDLHLLTQQSDPAGLALNRRTEWVFYGLLAGS